MKIMFLGDMKFDEPVKIEEKIIELCRNCDLVIGNLEGPILPESTLGKDEFKNKRYSTDLSIEYLKKLNLSIVNLANNHTMDFGVDGMNRTTTKLDENNISYVGLKNNQENEEIFYKSFTYMGKSIGLLAFAHCEGLMGTNTGVGPVPLPSFTELKEIASGLKKKVDILLFFYHGGEEYYTVPWPRRRNYFKCLAKYTDIDVIVGHHSHTVQPLEIIDGKPIIYSLGNFHFVSEVQKLIANTEKGLMVLLDTDSLEINLFRTILDRDKSKLSIYDAEFMDGSDVLLSEDEMIKEWWQQCKHSMKPQRGFFSNKIFWIFGPYLRRGYILARALKDKNCRDVDIVCATLPGIKKLNIMQSTSIKSAQRFRY